MNYCRQRVKLLDIVGEGDAQVLFQIDTSLPYADPLVVNPIVDEKFEIQDVRKHIFPGKIVIQGKLVKNIIYKAVKKSFAYIAHQTVIEPFGVEIPIPGLRKGFMIGQRRFFGPICTDDLHLQVFITDVQSDTILGDEKTVPCVEPVPTPREETIIHFHHSGLQQQYRGKHCCQHKGHRPPDHDECTERSVHEKVIVTIKVVAAKQRIHAVPVCPPPQIFHCTCEQVCEPC